MTESKYWSLKPFYSKLAITSNDIIINEFSFNL